MGAELLHVPLHRPAPANVAEAVDHIVRLQAVQGWTRDLEAAYRQFLQGQADLFEVASGGAFNVKSPSGHALRTAPKQTVTVTDGPALAEWLNDQADDTLADMLPVVTDRVTLGPLGHHDTATILDALRSAVDADLGAAVREHLTVTQHLAWPQDVGDRLRDHPRTIIAGGLSWLDTHTGEVVPVPGVQVTEGRRDLRVTPDKAVAAGLRTLLEEAIGPPQLVADHEQEGAQI